jgi:hypothetical protein
MSPEFQRFVDSFLQGTPDREYFEPAAELIDALELEITELAAFACIWVLDMSTIEMVDGRVVGSAISPYGGVGDLCDLIAIKFASINSDPKWWCAAYRWWTRPANEMRPAVRGTLSQIRTLAAVKHVDSSIK